MADLPPGTIPVGESGFDFAASGRGVSFLPLPIGQSKKLSDWAEELTFFSLGLLFAHGFGVGPLEDFCAKIRSSLVFYHVKFTRPLFSGMVLPNGSKEWNHVLFAIEHVHWKELLNFILSIAVTNTANKTLFGIGYQSLNIVDPLYIERSAVIAAVPPMLSIGSFGINGNRELVSLQYDVQPLNPPRVVYAPPDPAQVVFADALFAGKNPHIALEIWRKSQDANQNRNSA